MKSVSKGRILLWVLFFPIMLSILIAKSNRFDKKVKAILITLVCVITIGVGISSGSEDEQGLNTEQANVSESVESSSSSNNDEEFVDSSKDDSVIEEIENENVDISTIDQEISSTDNTENIDTENETNENDSVAVDIPESNTISSFDNSFDGYSIIEVDGGNLSGHREPNVVVDIGFGDREYYAFTNEYGQLVKVTAVEIILQDDSTEPVTSKGRYYHDEAKVPGVESSTLDEGHVIADSLGGVANAYNITPQNSTLNRHGDQAYMEKVIRDAGGCTDFTAIITYPNTTTQIPNHYSFTYKLNGNVVNDEFDNINPDEANTDNFESEDDIQQAVTNESVNENVITIKELDKGAEFVIIINNGNNDVNIGGWILVSEKGNQTFEFPSEYILKVGQECKLTSGDISGTGDFTMANGTIWNNSSSDPAVLYDGDWNEIDRYDK